MLALRRRNWAVGAAWLANVLRSQASSSPTASRLRLGPAYSTAGVATSEDSAVPPLPPARWLSDLRTRIGKCIIFGCTQSQIREAAGVLRVLATEWRQLTAGSEGFLTGPRRGLEGQKVAWGEMDSFGHVNNVIYSRYAETARVNWVVNFAVRVDPAHGTLWSGLMSTRSVGLIMKSLKTEFKFPMTYPDSISVYHKLRVPPATNSTSTSLLLDCMVLSHRQMRIAARTFEDIAIYDYRVARKTEMPEFMHNVLVDVWRQQQDETVRARTRIWELARAVEQLEKKTWDRPDAVEDVGSAAGGTAIMS
ncbi:hypothetical protein CMQ_7056 [Grosmannia clavigera kw1407]|uniref:Thioesterase thiol ester dehydrase-isomerase n=1 Tax=Grosmannia clavigera (strain kw1407 / UAMH 11150) TaxID=655863 RepID=F0XP04_GROCL|nr:uncharacterized protein CMQ_7056 [Grosmannia clavigera kw1407]EFX00054.1 hypothetical protein CMQ_7056 [Grosmannia clavigera kw1407]